MKLEAKDRKGPTLTCVATINEVNSKGELLIHFDGWTSTFDYWCTPDTADIHPREWCDRNSKDLQPPKGKCRFSIVLHSQVIFDAQGYSGTFDWDTHLSKSGAEAAPESLFTPVRSSLAIA